jgi:hypothetical protein
MADLGLAKDKPFATWCVMVHARPVLVRALRAWGLGTSACAIERAASLTALRMVALDVDADVRKTIRFVPLRRDLSNALNTLHAAATFASRGDAANTAVVVIGVFTNASSALAWRRPWMQLSWRRYRAEVITSARREQSAYRADHA